MLVVGLDPGLITGVAIYDGKKIKAGILDDSWWPEIWAANHCVIEKPRMYRTHPRPNDLITLAIRAGELGGIYDCGCSEAGSHRYVYPSDWKGQLDKDKSWSRTLTILSETELASVANVLQLPKTKRHNVQDAITIALYGAGKKIL